MKIKVTIFLISMANFLCASVPASMPVKASAKPPVAVLHASSLPKPALSIAQRLMGDEALSNASTEHIALFLSAGSKLKIADQSFRRAIAKTKFETELHYVHTGVMQFPTKSLCKGLEGQTLAYFSIIVKGHVQKYFQKKTTVQAQYLKQREEIDKEYIKVAEKADFGQSLDAFAQSIEAVFAQNEKTKDTLIAFLKEDRTLQELVGAFE